jgi:hypothetical protein
MRWHYFYCDIGKETLGGWCVGCSSRGGSDRNRGLRIHIARVEVLLRKGWGLSLKDPIQPASSFQALFTTAGLAATVERG